MLILDTNVISALRRPERAARVAAWLARQEERDLFLSVITLGEIERGIAIQEKINPTFAADLRGWLDKTATVFADRILPFGAEEARVWGRLTHQIGHAGADLMIAATALVRNGVVVTGNVDDFKPTGVRIENPF